LPPSLACGSRHYRSIPAGPVFMMVSLVADSCRSEAFNFSRIKLHSVGMIVRFAAGQGNPQGIGPSSGTRGKSRARKSC
jgi:hypothetical protein